MKLEQGAVRVYVSRPPDGQLKPSDFFSASQLQVLMLGVFLSANLTQTWSGFRPVLLDDPVEHFDDVNSYSLVDLMKTLVSAHSRQVFVSTCDYGLFQLMRRRLAGLQSGAKFYEFQSIGTDGPVVKPVEGLS